MQASLQPNSGGENSMLLIVPRGSVRVALSVKRWDGGGCMFVEPGGWREAVVVAGIGSCFHNLIVPSAPPEARRVPKVG